MHPTLATLQVINKYFDFSSVSRHKRHIGLPTSTPLLDKLNFVGNQSCIALQIHSNVDGDALIFQISSKLPTLSSRSSWF